MKRIDLPASKSISNRALVLQALSSCDVKLENLADCDDTNVLIRALGEMPNAINIGACGTAMRFLTAFLSVRDGESHILTGTDRMLERPIKILVDALTELGADIKYLGKTGYPPLLITGKKLEGGRLTIDGSVSSQYISALMMVGAFMPRGLKLNFKGKVVSKPYIEMTRQMIAVFREIFSQHPTPNTQHPIFTVESDWSAASYWYEYLALNPDNELQIELPGLHEKSMQGDSVVKFIFSLLGVKTEFTEDGVIIKKTGKGAKALNFDFSNCPDLVQTLVCTCCGMGVPFEFTGVETLRIKETDRIEALRVELRKLGIRLRIEDNSKISWDGVSTPPCGYDIDTYHDHRMAMSFAPLQQKFPLLRINNPEVVSKSYPEFWNQFPNLNS